MSKVDKIVDSVNDKVESLNSVFNIIDFTTDKLTFFVDRIGEAISNIFSKLMRKKEIKKERDYEEE